MVIGSRFISNNNTFKSTFARRIGIRIISKIMKLITNKKIYDTTSGFRAINRLIIKDFAMSYPLEYPEPITTSELLRKNYIVKEIPVKMKERNAGVSSIKTWKNAYYMVNVVLSLIVVRIRRYRKCQ